MWWNNYWTADEETKERLILLLLQQLFFEDLASYVYILFDMAQVLPWTCYVNTVLCLCYMWNCVYVCIICLKIFMFSQHIFHHMDINSSCCNDGYIIKLKGTLKYKIS